jgi:hypothetical protein
MTKPTRRRSDNVVAMHSAGQEDSFVVDRGETARRAYELFCERGQVHGHDLDDWLLAERELRETRSSTAA